MRRPVTLDFYTLKLGKLKNDMSMMCRRKNPSLRITVQQKVMPKSNPGDEMLVSLTYFFFMCLILMKDTYSIALKI